VFTAAQGFWFAYCCTQVGRRAAQTADFDADGLADPRLPLFGVGLCHGGM